MVEKNFQSLFSAWVVLPENFPKVSTAWELKLQKKGAIPFNRVDDHQVENLLKVKYKGFYLKIADSPVSWMKGTPMRFGMKKGFDCLCVVNGEAYVVLLFYKLRQKKEMLFIDIDRWIQEKETATRKSLTEQRAREISSYIKTL